MELSKKEKDVLFHTLGFDCVYSFLELRRVDTPTRNYTFCTLLSEDGEVLQSLIDKGLMIFKCQSLNKNDDAHYYEATESGISLAQELIKNSLPKLTRSKKRYRAYLHSDTSETFIEWLRNPYWDKYRKSYGVQ